MKKTFKDIVNENLTEKQKEFFAKVFKFETPIITPDNTAVTPPAPTANAETKTADGTVIKSDTAEFVVGSVVTVVTPDGEVPAPDGEVVVENGNTFVTEKGIIKEIKVAEVVPPVAGVTPEEMANMKSDYDNKLAESAKIISALVARFDSVEKENGVLKSKFENFASEFSKLMELPIGEPIKTEQNFTITKKEKAINIFKK